MGYLEGIHSPDDIKKLKISQLQELSGEIRKFLIENVSHTGGHLSSNLGTVELTLALHKVFHSPQDCFIFDVGHQCYTHKIITGRMDDFSTLRQAGGLSGFPSPAESIHDPLVEGHGNVAISQAIGIASAKKLKGEPGYVIAVVGDGAFTGGMVYEGLNNIGRLNNLIVILNDNKMSISKNVGAVSQYFTSLRTAAGYNRAKRNVQSFLNRLPLIGKPIERLLIWVKSVMRRWLYHRSTWFEDMGFLYHGPMDGHNIAQMCRAFTNVVGQDRPNFIHLVTVKGKGYQPAEDNPGNFHGVSAFEGGEVPDPEQAPSDSFSNVFGRRLVQMARADERICGITAAMKYGTGLQFFHKQIPSRMFDVGMAEQHAVSFAAGLAQQGMLPVVAIYSTFLQRAYDQIIHDVVLNRLNVLFAIDRAGLVPADGATHQGIYDVAFLRQMEHLPVYSPCNYAELEYWLGVLLTSPRGPSAIRYPRGGECAALRALGCSRREYDLLDSKADRLLISYGALFEECLDTQKLLKENGGSLDLMKLNRVFPIPEQAVQEMLRYREILFAEDTMESGGIGEALGDQLLKAGYGGFYRHKGIRHAALDHAGVEELRRQEGLDAATLAKELEHHA